MGSLPQGQGGLPPVGPDEQRLSSTAGRATADVWAAIGRLSQGDGATGEIETIAHIQDIFRALRALLSDLKMAVDEQDTPEEQYRLAHHLAYYQSEYDRAQEAFQEAKLALQRNRELAYMRQQRAELIGSLDYSARQRKFQSEQELLQGQEDVTAALRRTRQLMAQNVEQQHGNLSVLDASNTKLGSTRDELHGQKQVFKQSHGLLGTLKRQATMQWVWVFIALGIFSSSVVYVGIRRTPVAVKDSVMAAIRAPLRAAGFDISGPFRGSNRPGAGGLRPNAGVGGRPGPGGVGEEAWRSELSRLQRPGGVGPGAPGGPGQQQRRRVDPWEDPAWLEADGKRPGGNLPPRGPGGVVGGPGSLPRGPPGSLQGGRPQPGIGGPGGMPRPQPGGPGGQPLGQLGGPRPGGAPGDRPSQLPPVVTRRDVPPGMPGKPPVPEDTRQPELQQPATPGRESVGGAASLDELLQPPIQQPPVQQQPVQQQEPPVAQQQQSAVGEVEEPGTPAALQPEPTALPSEDLEEDAAAEEQPAEEATPEPAAQQADEQEQQPAAEELAAPEEAAPAEEQAAAEEAGAVEPEAEPAAEEPAADEGAGAAEAAAQAAEQERLRQEAAAEAERKRQQEAEAERQRQFEEAERLRSQQEAEERAHKQQEEAERLRQQQEEADRLRRQQEEEAARLKRQQEEEAARIRKQQEEAERKRQQEEAERKRQQEEAERLRRQQEEEEAARKQQEREEQQRREQEVAALASLPPASAAQVKLKQRRQNVASNLLAKLTGRPGKGAAAAAGASDPLRVDPGALPSRQLLWTADEGEDNPAERQERILERARELLPPSSAPAAAAARRGWWPPPLLPQASAAATPAASPSNAHRRPADDPLQDYPDEPPVKMSLLPGDEEFDGAHVQALLDESAAAAAEEERGGQGGEDEEEGPLDPRYEELLAKLEQRLNGLRGGFPGSGGRGSGGGSGGAEDGEEEEGRGRSGSADPDEL